MAFRLPLYITKQPTLQEFTSSGTWTKPTGCTRIIIAALGAGGGGGGGGIGDAIFSHGGAHGGGGFLVVASFINNDIPSGSYSVTVGTGGSGGAGRTAASTGDGVGGSIGGNTRFHTGATNLVLAIGGYGGSRGRYNNQTNNFASSGTVLNCLPLTTFQTTNTKTQIYTGGMDTAALGAVNSIQGLNTQFVPVNLRFRGGGASGGRAGGYSDAAPSGTPLSGGTVPNQNIYVGCPILQTNLVGSGGGGGEGGDGSSNGTNGSNGGRCAGGGGGGATSVGFNAGNGGNGGNGLCLIWEFYD